jgi:hypothetical protein
VPESKRVLSAIALIVRSGVCGASVMLALSATEALADSNQSPKKGVSDRLDAIRTGVSNLTQNPLGPNTPDAAIVAGDWPNWHNWRNGGWGRWPGWGNGGGWHNWGNGGWGNGGWRNGGWNNGWHNFWHNW